MIETNMKRLKREAEGKGDSEDWSAVEVDVWQGG